MSQTTKRPLARYGLFLTASQIIQIGIAFGANLVLVRFLIPAEFGTFAIAFAAISLLFSIFSCRVYALVIRTPNDRYDDNTKDRYYNVMLLETFFSTATALIWFSIVDNVTHWDLALIFALAVRHWIQGNRAFFERGMPYQKLSLVETVAPIFAHTVSVVLILNGFGIATLYIREIILTLVELVALGMVGGITIRRVRWIGIGPLRSVLLEARGVWIDGILETGYQRLILLATGFFGGTSAAGYFFQASRLAMIPHQLLSPVLSRLAANWISRAESQSLQISRRKGFIRLAFFPLVLLGIAAILWADPIVPWIFGDNWSRSADLLVALSGVIVFLSLFEVLKSYCIVTRRMRILLIGRIMQ
ncbi:MAG: oligosaccharide flippase family protein, partial [Proteobacteria bacterium]|nr:oligosaccharide flippase family protein [Pseudomonadota bacterium]